ncbi:MAG: class I SAM-dependent methyltransferase, partial [candidate division Zixibacteria bacterium]|nr:class I SAM-dependent methyltransferase [candidate division Zixibacteria bacterium]
RVSGDFLIEKLGVAEHHRRLLGRILEILEEEGILKRSGEQWEVRKIPAAFSLEEYWRLLIQQYPAYQAELVLVQRFGENFAKILTGELEPLTLIFPEGSTNIAEHLYQDSPTFNIYNLLLQKTFSYMVNRLPGGRSIRILEIGGGTGGSSSYVLPTLPENRTEYIFSDVSQQFMTAAEQKLKNYPFVKYRILDIESDPFAQGFEEHSFDVILASNVLHATRDLKATLENVKKLLTPRGLLVLLEGTHFSHSVDLIFGSLKGWWLFEDLDLRPSHPTLPLAKWRDLLAESGFSEVAWLSDADAEKAEQSVIIAQYPDHREEPAGEENFVPVLPENPGKWLIFADRFGIAEELANRFTALDEIPILISPGETFKEVEKNHFQIQPDQPE